MLLDQVPYAEEIARASVPLAPFTSFGIGGPAEILVEPRGMEELREVYVACLRAGADIHLIGRGTNILIDDRGLPGVVIRISGERMGQVTRHDNRISAAAGAGLQGLLGRAAKWGLSGLEVLAGIPGSVGGAMVMNAGTREGSIGDLVESVYVIDSNGALQARVAGEIEFGYRRSGLAGEIVVEAVLVCGEDEPERAREAMQEAMRRRRQGQPAGGKSAGCVFKNPPGEAAGALIDRAGLKGASSGGAVVSPRHANYIVNEGGATAADIMRLIDRVRHEVAAQFGIELELEIEIWPAGSSR